MNNLKIFSRAHYLTVHEFNFTDFAFSQMTFELLEKNLYAASWKYIRKI